MSYCFKSYDIVGYTLEGSIYCPQCADIEITINGNPIFADSEWDYAPVCEECHEELECFSLIE